MDCGRSAGRQRGLATGAARGGRCVRRYVVGCSRSGIRAQRRCAARRRWCGSACRWRRRRNLGLRRRWRQRLFCADGRLRCWRRAPLLYRGRPARGSRWLRRNRRRRGRRWRGARRWSRDRRLMWRRRHGRSGVRRRSHWWLMRRWRRRWCRPGWRRRRRCRSGRRCRDWRRRPWRRRWGWRGTRRLWRGRWRSLRRRLRFPIRTDFVGLRDHQRRGLPMRRRGCELHRRKSRRGKQHETKVGHDDLYPLKIQLRKFSWTGVWR
jgi:hypothetical protein